MSFKPNDRVRFRYEDIFVPQGTTGTVIDVVTLPTQHDIVHVDLDVVLDNPFGEFDKVQVEAEELELL